MNKFLIIAASAALMTSVAQAESLDNLEKQGEKSEKIDSTKMYELQEVQVVSTRATKNTPIAFSTVTKDDLKALNHGEDLPQLLQMTPSVTVTSDAGNGIGYTSIYIRGNDGTRVNVTANGIPINDAESSGVYWVNMPDFASSAQDIQVQRGAGTSTNGAGAFGATINIQTEKIGMKPFLGIDLSAGSYYSHKETVRFGTGLLGGHWGIQGRLSNIGSKGYLDRASTKLNSYFLQGGYFGDKTVVKFITFNGQEETYHAWNYASAYEQILFGRTFNSCGLENLTTVDGKTQTVDLTYDPESAKAELMKGGHFNYYPEQKDFYHQQHYQLFLDQILTKDLKLNVGVHYTRGDGYYEQYKANKKLVDYGLAASKSRTDLINQKKMANDFFGFVASLNYNNKKGLQATLGGGWNRYVGDHFGYVTWVKDPSEIQNYSSIYEYYNNTAWKNDGNIYGKVNWEFWKGLSAYVDLQYRHTGIEMVGPTDEFALGTAADGTKYIIQSCFDQLNQYDFFNPKFGLNYNITKNHTVYASMAITHKEPTRNDFEDNAGEALEAEKLVDWEAGYRFSSPKFAAGINLYYMNYTNQFVLTGQLNAIGEPVKTNSGKSYRMGMELEASWKPVDWFRWDANATLSKNRNKDWQVQLCNPETWEYSEPVNLGETPISFSPSFIFNNILTFKYKGFQAKVMSQYIGKRYMNNTGMESFEVIDGVHDGMSVSTMLDDFFKTDVDLSYTTNFFKRFGVKEATIGVTLYNIFNKQYNNNGWTYSEVAMNKYGQFYAWSDSPCETGLAPSAPFNFMVNLSVNF